MKKNIFVACLLVGVLSYAQDEDVIPALIRRFAQEVIQQEETSGFVKEFFLKEENVTPEHRAAVYGDPTVWGNFE